ncbi:hypothetical protein M2140_000375 [Clostridiales Family XIII bacterium PM5-7]
MNARKKVLLIYTVSLLATCPSVMDHILSSIEITLDIVLVTIGISLIEGIAYGTVITIIALCLRIVTLKQIKENR